MVRLTTINTIPIATFLLNSYFQTQKHFTNMKVANGFDKPCLYSIWHSDLISLYAFGGKKISVMISKSRDGEIIANATEKMGVPTIRGSLNRAGAIEASKNLVSRLKAGEQGAMVVDGPRGPANVVKKGIVKIAQMAEVPIVPMIMYSPSSNLHRLPGWDKTKYPLGFIKILDLCGDPIFIEGELTDERIEEYRQKIQDEMLKLEELAVEKFKEVF